MTDSGSSEPTGAGPDSDDVLPADADRPDWLAARLSGIGGSDASTIAGVNPYSSLYELWLDKTGQAIEKPVTSAMRFGHLIEGPARQVFTEDTGIGVRLSGLQRSKARPWQLCTPDGITDDGGLFECKSVGWRLADDWGDDQIGDHAEVQVQHGMDVTGLRHAWVIACIDREFVIRRVDYDPELAATIRGMADEFWHRNVLDSVEPAIVARDLGAARRRWAIASQDVKLSSTPWLPEQLAELADVKRAAADLADRRARLEAELIDYIGDAEGAGVIDENGDGFVTVTRKSHTRAGFDKASFGADHPDLLEKYTTTTYYRQLNVLSKPKKVS